MDIGAWLRDLGLDRYEQAFRENDIASAVLPELTDRDLKDLGVSLGHRRLLLKAIADLATRDADAALASAAEAAPRTDRATGAERRQLTVMFVDLVGSTELAARLDPEDMGGVIRGYQKCCAQVIGRWGGHVAKYMGDGVLAYFGWPQAHEDEAERAVRAGLELTAAVARVSTEDGALLAARVGIATGLVMVGELTGEGAAREEAVVGETPNLAARLQAFAKPGSVVISQATRQLLGGLFELADLGPRRLKGFAEPLAAWRVKGEGRAEGRFEARQTASLTPLVGREEEIALLLRRWQQAKDGEGHVVLLYGEPGIGKSRLVREVRARLEGEPHVRLLYQCSPHRTTSPLHPLIEQLQRAAGFERDEPPEARLDKLETLLARGTSRLDQAVPLIAALLGLSMEGRYPMLDLTPQRQKQLTLAALVEQLEGLAAAQPVLLAYEDMHWSDPTTQELLGLTIEHIQHLPVLLLITFRPEFSPPWPSQPHVSALALSRLGRRDGAALVGRVVKDKRLPEEVAAQIVAKTDGVPLFVEELTKTVLESGLLTDAGDHFELSGPLPPLAIPATLHDSLLARLDRLAPIKEIAQIGAALGREFSHALLAAVADPPEADLQAALDQLVAAELIYRRGNPPEATYSFKHALVQDTAYQSLLKSKRQQLHVRIAQTLEQQFPETAASEPELIARHLTEAGLAEKAVAYRHRAGELAIRRSAMQEAIAELAAGLELLQSLPEDAGRDGRELELQIALGNALNAAKGQSAPEAGRAFARTCELCRKRGDTPELFPALLGQYSFHFQRGELATALEVAQELLRRAEERGDDAARVAGHRLSGGLLLHLGQLAMSRAHLEAGVALYDPTRDRSSCFVYAFDSRVICLHWLANALLAQGYPDQARTQNRELFAYARELAHPNTLADAHFCACNLYQLLRQEQDVQEQAEALIALATEQGFPFWLATGVFFRASAVADSGGVEDAIADMRRGLTDYRATHAELWSPYFLGLLARAHANAGRADEGLRLLAEASERVEQTDSRWNEADLYRLRGELLLALPEINRREAERCFRKAIEVAREQGAKWWELRAATSLARLWRDWGRQAEAHDLLAPVYGWFTEGFDTADLKDAKALLEELG